MMWAAPAPPPADPAEAALLTAGAAAATAIDAVASRAMRRGRSMGVPSLEQGSDGQRAGFQRARPAAMARATHRSWGSTPAARGGNPTPRRPSNERRLLRGALEVRALRDRLDVRAGLVVRPGRD